MEDFLIHYGYIAIFLAMFVQGKSMAFAAGIIAHHGEFNIGFAIVAVVAGSYVCDWVFYGVGRFLGPRLYDRRPRWRQRAERTRELLSRHPLILLMFYRFIPGVRMVTPAVIGVTRFSAIKFLVLDFISAAVGMSILTWAGFGFGKLLVRLFAGAHDWEIGIAITIALLATVCIVIFERHHKQACKRKMEMEAAAGEGSE